jgi:hypothetical protein
MSKQLPPPQPRAWQESLATLAARALIALVLVLIVGNIFNADHAFFKFGAHRDALRQTSVYGILAYGLTLVNVSGVFAHRRGQRRLVGPGDGAVAGAALHRHPRAHGAGARRGEVCFRGHEGLHGGAECRKYYNGAREGSLQGGGTAGGLGLDQEFFESALVPQVMLNGFLGFAPRADGFKLDPRLPKDWPEFSLDRIRYQNLVLQVRVATNLIEIQKQGKRDEPMFVLLPEASWKATWLREDVSGLRDAALTKRTADGAWELNWNGATGIRFESQSEKP